MERGFRKKVQHCLLIKTLSAMFLFAPPMTCAICSGENGPDVDSLTSRAWPQGQINKQASVVLFNAYFISPFSFLHGGPGLQGFTRGVHLGEHLHTLSFRKRGVTFNRIPEQISLCKRALLWITEPDCHSELNI